MRNWRKKENKMNTNSTRTMSTTMERKKTTEKSMRSIHKKREKGVLKKKVINL